EFAAVITAAFGEHPEASEAALFAELRTAGRQLGASDGDRLVGTAGAFEFGLTLPGGAVVPVAGVTAVGVAATHRRRGILRQLMAAQLDDVAARGEPLAVLTASESGIYRRFGYGIASFVEVVDLETVRVAFREPVGADLDLRLIRGDEAMAAIPPLYDRWRATRPGPFT